MGFLSQGEPKKITDQNERYLYHINPAIRRGRWRSLPGTIGNTP